MRCIHYRSKVLNNLIKVKSQRFLKRNTLYISKYIQIDIFIYIFLNSTFAMGNFYSEIILSCGLYVKNVYVKYLIQDKKTTKKHAFCVIPPLILEE